MELLLKTFSLTQDEFELHNKKSTQHIKSYFNRTMDKKYIDMYKYLDYIDDSLPEYCEFGADKCWIKNFKEFCSKLDIDIIDNLSRIIKEDYYLFENKHEILTSPESFYKKITERGGSYHFYNRDKTFMFTCTSPLYMDGSLGYFGCTGLQKYVIKAFELIYNDGNVYLSYGGREYV